MNIEKITDAATRQIIGYRIDGVLYEERDDRELARLTSRLAAMESFVEAVRVIDRRMDIPMLHGALAALFRLDAGEKPEAVLNNNGGGAQ